MKPTLNGLLRFWFWSDDRTRPEHVSSERVGKISLWVIPILVGWAAHRSNSPFLWFLTSAIAFVSYHGILGCNRNKLPGRVHSIDQ